MDSKEEKNSNLIKHFSVLGARWVRILLVLTILWVGFGALIIYVIQIPNNFEKYSNIVLYEDQVNYNLAVSDTQSDMYIFDCLIKTFPYIKESIGISYLVSDPNFILNYTINVEDDKPAIYPDSSIPIYSKILVRTKYRATYLAIPELKELFSSLSHYTETVEKGAYGESFTKFEFNITESNVATLQQFIKALKVKE